MEDIKALFENYPILLSLLEFIGVFLLAFVTYLIVKKLLIAGIHKIVKKSKTDFDDILLSEALLEENGLFGTNTCSFSVFIFDSSN